MHDPFVQGLEDHLSGKTQADALARFRAHLDECSECRATVSEFERQARLLRVLRPEEEVEPAPGFYARVRERIEAQSAGSLWSLLLDPFFARKLMYASLTLLVLLGSAVVTSDSHLAIIESVPYEIMAETTQSPAPGVDPSIDREIVFVNLATYNGTGAALLPASVN